MIREISRQAEAPSIYHDLTFTERLSLLVERESSDRDAKRLLRMLKNAKFKEHAMIEEINWTRSRGLPKAQFLALATNQWIHEKQNVLMIGPTGIGKSWLSCALGMRACQDGYTVIFKRISRLFEELNLAVATGTYLDALTKLSQPNLLILDDLAHPFNESERRQFFEIIDRNLSGSLIITSQFPIDKWHEIIGDPNTADGILDRVIHRSHKFALKGPTMRDEYSSMKKPPSERKISAMDLT